MNPEGAAMNSGQVGWIGAGRMGQAMVERLLDAGVEVIVWNRSPEKVTALAERGARIAATPAEAAAAPVVFSMVTDDAALDALRVADDGVLGRPGAPRAWVDCSSVSPAAADRAATAAHEWGVAFASAPVSGNPGAVRAGNAVFAISGDQAAIDAALPALRVIGRNVHAVGTGRQASVVKLCTNAVLAVLIQSLAEVLVLGEKCGVRRGDLMTFINDSAIGSPFSRYKTASLVELDMTPAFTAVGQRKDIRLALGLAAETETPMPVLSSTEVAFSRLVASGLGDGIDFAALILLAARDAGIELQPERS